MSRGMSRAGNAKAGGQYLRSLRAARGWTQRDVEDRTAVLLGDGDFITQQTIAKLEDGQVSQPKMFDLSVLGKVYNVGLDDLAKAYEYPYTASPYRIADETLREFVAIFLDSSVELQARIRRWVEGAIYTAKFERNNEHQNEGAL